MVDPFLDPLRDRSYSLLKEFASSIDPRCIEEYPGGIAIPGPIIARFVAALVEEYRQKHNIPQDYMDRVLQHFFHPHGINYLWLFHHHIPIIKEQLGETEYNKQAEEDLKKLMLFVNRAIAADISERLEGFSGYVFAYCSSYHKEAIIMAVNNIASKLRRKALVTSHFNFSR